MSQKSNENESMSRKISYCTTLLLLAGIHLYAQEKQPPRWTVEACIDYAVDHNHQVRQQLYAQKIMQSQHIRAIGNFLPYVSAGTSIQNNYGRAIDPETNTYTDVSTFSNGYSLSASISLFEGFRRYHDLRTAKAQILLGRQGLQAQKDQVALSVLQAYLNVLYCQEMVRMTEEKRKQSQSLLRQTEVMLEIGMKGEPDRAQMSATLAADEYELTHQKNLLEKAILTLKKEMNFPIGDTLALETVRTETESEQVSAPEAVIYQQAQTVHPSILQAQTSIRIARSQLQSAKSGFYPSLSLSMGMSSSYYKNINDQQARHFAEQMKNNSGQYISATLSIPLFNRLNTITGIRDRRNNLKQARENLEYEQQELHRLITEAVSDRESACMELRKIEQQVQADSIASGITIRKWEEGLASPIDVQTAAVTLLQSEAQRLQCWLNYIYNTRLLDYYQGKPLWTEK